MICRDCAREIENSVIEIDYLCPECARIRSNILFDRILSTFESEDDLTRASYALYGIDDFAYIVDREIEK